MQTLLPLLALLTSLVSLCIASSYAKHLFDQVGIEGVSALRIGFSMVLLVCAMRRVCIQKKRKWYRQYKYQVPVSRITYNAE